MNRKAYYLVSVAMLLFFIGTLTKVNGSEGNLQEQKERIESKTADGKEVKLYLSNYVVKYKGYIELTPDDKDIVYVSPGGYVKISRISFGNARSIIIQGKDDGSVSKHFFIGKKEVDFASEGKKWLADILPEIVRETGVGAEFRVSNIYKTSGITGLLEEIEKIDHESGAARNLYFAITIDNVKLNDDELLKIIPKMTMIESNSTKGTLLRDICFKYELSVKASAELIKTARTLDYNTERGSLLRVMNPNLIENDLVLDQYFRLINEMSINSEKGNVLKDLMKKKELVPGTWIRLFESVSLFSLEREKGAVLYTALDYMPNNERVIQAYSNAVDDLDSDYYVLKGELLNGLMEMQLSDDKGKKVKGNKTVAIQTLKTAETFDSRSQKALSFRKVNTIFVSDKEVYEAYIDAFDGMHWVEQYNVLIDLVDKNKLDKAGYLMVFRKAKELVSDDYQHAAGAVLRACLEKMPQDDDLINEFFDIVQEMNQNSTIEELVRLALQNKKIEKSSKVVPEAIEATERIDVDIEKASLLLLIKPKIEGKDHEVAYKFAQKLIESDYHFRKVNL